VTFLPKREAKLPCLPMVHTVGVKEVSGDIGIEIEVEGNKFPKHAYDGYDPVDPDRIPKQWLYHRDGSLRGEDNAEYVLKKPLKFSEVPKAINDLWQMFSDYGTVLDVSNRTSVHVHLNVQDFYINRLCSFAAMYLSVEDILTGWCGDHRVGNLFCLRAKDAPAIVTELKDFFKLNGKKKFSGGMHYAGFNPSSLHRFGSIEIRTLRGCIDPADILTWVGVLQRIYDLSAEYEDPRRVVEGFSGEGPMAYLERILGPYTQTILEGCSMNSQDVIASLYEGIRFAQDLCYCRDWSNIEKVEFKPDPFGRKTKPSDVFQTFYASIENTGLSYASNGSAGTGPAPMYPTPNPVEEEYYEPDIDIDWDED
jgi:hypothetical protein